MRTTLAALVILSQSLASFAAASPLDERMSPDLRARIHLDRRFGVETSDRSLVVRFASPLTEAEIAALERADVRFQRLGGVVRHVGPFYGVRVGAQGLARLTARSDVRSLLPALPRMVSPLPSPLGEYNQIHGMTTTRDVWPLRDAEGRRLTGEGRIVADIDSGIDVFHPMFFKPDAGLHAWVDVDGNGRLDPGIDGIDADGDGAIGAGEVLSLLDAGQADLHTGQPSGKDGKYTAGYDWLYVDEDGNGRRSFGPNDGYTEKFPGYGEPLYTADDVDGSGSVEVGEKLVQLGTSKIRALLTVGNGKVYTRGEDLIMAPQTGEAALHGTGVAGILVGGVLGSAVHGVAPGAELLMIDHSAPGPAAYGADPWLDLVSAAAWARDEGACVITHEYGTQFGEFADGSSDWEQMLDQLTDDGVVQATATHNFAGYSGHGVLDVQPKGDLDVPIVAMDLAMYGFDIHYLIITMRWRGAPDDALDGTMLMPDGTSLPLGEEIADPTGWYLTTQRGTSGRGTSLLLIYALMTDTMSVSPLPAGPYHVLLKNASDKPLDVQVSIGDDTGYSYGVHLDEGVTDKGTMAFPSTADSAISVGASVGNEHEWGEQEGGLKFFSGRGPRIDGELGIDVVAPEDHYTASFGSATESNNYARFGGTSGALPQVGGALLLLLQSAPDLTPLEVRDRLHASGGSDTITGATPNEEWGYGRLLTHRLVTGADAPTNAPPVLGVEVADAYAGRTTVLDGSASTDADDGPQELTFRWDTDYDGQWDEVPGEGPMAEVVFDEVGTYFVKAQVEDSLGWTSEALVEVVVTEAPPEPDPEPQVDAGGTTGPAPDADVVVATDPDAAATADTSAAADTAPAKTPSGDDGGCASAPGGDGAGPWVVLALVVLGGLQRRRAARGAVRGA